MPHVSLEGPLSLRTGMFFTDVLPHIKTLVSKKEKSPGLGLDTVYARSSPEQAGSCKGRGANGPSGV